MAEPRWTEDQGSAPWGFVDCCFPTADVGLHRLILSSNITTRALLCEVLVITKSPSD